MTLLRARFFPLHYLREPADATGTIISLCRFGIIADGLVRKILSHRASLHHDGATG
jgi:hypothetical protein